MTTLAEQLAQRALAKRSAAYTDEVQRLIDAGRALMVGAGAGRGPRVADIVAAAGLSNDAFYRHFPSKGALVAAVVQDGALRLRDYLAHQMSKDADPEAQVRRWVRGVLAQAEGEVAQQTRAVLQNAPEATVDGADGRSLETGLGELLVPALAALGSPRPELVAQLAGHATVGLLAEHLRRHTVPSPDEVEAVTGCWVEAARAGR